MSRASSRREVARRRIGRRGAAASTREQPEGPLLLLDSGNSRLKWALSRDPDPQAPFAANGVIELAALRRSTEPLLRVLHSCGPLAHIHACNVAGPAVQRSIRVAAAGAGLGRPRFARSAAAAAGVRNAYAEPWRLGVDRWMALIGAHSQYPGRALCIVAIGSALTIDLLGADGCHHGGCIAPGPSMMIASLLAHTAGIRRRAGLSAPGALERALASAHAEGSKRSQMLFAAGTRPALLAGAGYACATLIERALKEGHRRLGLSPRLILGGGGAETVAPLLGRHYTRRDDLVLRGLAVLAHDPNA
jgi:type III pantothenate kinase